MKISTDAIVGTTVGAILVATLIPVALPLFSYADTITTATSAIETLFNTVLPLMIVISVVTLFVGGSVAAYRGRKGRGR